MNFDNFVQRFAEGEVTPDDIEELLNIVYKDDEDAKRDRRERLFKDGQIVKFQAVGLNRQAKDIHLNDRAAELQAQSNPVPATDIPDEFAGDVPEDVFDGPDYVPTIKARVGIVQAVRTWGKPQATIKDHRSEGVKIRCPFPNHVDHRPSAWLNTQKATWYCGKCEVGGDVIDFYAAAKYGLSPNDFHRSTRFHEIVKEMADALGIYIVSTPDGGHSVETDTSTWASNSVDNDQEPEAPPSKPAPEESDDPAPPVTWDEFHEPKVPPSSEANEPITLSDEDVVRGIALDEELEFEDIFDTTQIPSYDWRRLNVPENTFFYQWMVQAEKELPWVPIEFFMALGLQAIGIACAHDTTAMTFARLTGSTMVVIVGETASGKSTATNRLDQLLERTPGARFDPAIGVGVKKITSTSSAEALLQRMRTNIEDPANPGREYEVPTNAWYHEDEMAQLISRARRTGGEHIKQRVMRFHDFVKTDPNPQKVAEDHSLTGGYRDVHDSYFTATFLAQNASIRMLAERNDLVSGFFNRIMFFMGESRHRRLMANAPVVDPDPPYLQRYDRLWKDCRMKSRTFQYTPEAVDLIDNHPLVTRLEHIAKMSDMFSRWQMMIFRVSFLLAVNENAAAIGVKHVNAAFDLVSRYLLPCAARVVQYVKEAETTPVSEFASEIKSRVEAFYDRQQRWPEPREIKKQRFWLTAPEAVKVRGEEIVKKSSVVEIELLDGPGYKRRKVWVVPSGDFDVYDGCNDKSYKHEAFYDGRTVR